MNKILMNREFNSKTNRMNLPNNYKNKTKILMKKKDNCRTM